MGDEGLEAMLPTSAQTNESTCLKFALFWASDVNFAVGLISEYPAGRGGCLGKLDSWATILPIKPLSPNKTCKYLCVETGYGVGNKEEWAWKANTMLYFHIVQGFPEALEGD